MSDPLLRRAATLLLVLLVPFATGCGNETPKSKPGSNRSSKSTGGSSSSSGSSSSQFVKDRPGKTPDEPAPALDERLFAQVNEYYERALQKRNDGNRARTAGNADEFRRLYNEALDELREGTSLIPDECIEWWDEANLSDWAMPGAYVAYEQWSAKWSKLESELHKLAR